MHKDLSKTIGKHISKRDNINENSFTKKLRSILFILLPVILIIGAGIITTNYLFGYHFINTGISLPEIANNTSGKNSSQTNTSSANLTDSPTSIPTVTKQNYLSTNSTYKESPTIVSQNNKPTNIILPSISIPTISFTSIPTVPTITDTSSSTLSNDKQMFINSIDQSQQGYAKQLSDLVSEVDTQLNIEAAGQSASLGAAVKRAGIVEEIQ